MGTFLTGRLVRAVQEKIFINTKTKQKSGSALEKTSRVTVSASDTLQGSAILVGVGLDRAQYITRFDVNGVAAIYDPGATDALMNSPHIKKKFKRVDQWFGFRLAGHPGPAFDTALTIDPFLPDMQIVPIVAWYEDEGLAAKHWLYGFSVVSQPDDAMARAAKRGRARTPRRAKKARRPAKKK